MPFAVPPAQVAGDGAGHAGVIVHRYDYRPKFGLTGRSGHSSIVRWVASQGILARVCALCRSAACRAWSRSISSRTEACCASLDQGHASGCRDSGSQETSGPAGESSRSPAGLGKPSADGVQDAGRDDHRAAGPECQRYRRGSAYPSALAQVSAAVTEPHLYLCSTWG